MSALATASVFLDLLARDAAAIEYDGPVVAARVAGAGAAELADLEAAKLVALQVRATLARSRRREAELVALFETAGDLAALRDLDAVLKAIVSRAHTLVGADVTYLTLDDPDRGDTYMRVTHGSVSAHFQSLRLPMGAGLGGLVAQTAKPYVTSDYPQDARFRHTTEIDDAVGEEGLIAILGVPLALGSRVIGVLFLERAALVVALHLLMRRSEAEAAERLGGDLLDDLLAVPVRHTSTLAERARRVGVDLDRPHVVVAADAAPADRSRAQFAAGRLAGAEGGLAGSHEGRIVLLLPGDDPSAAAQRVHSALRGGLAHPLTVGAGGPEAGVAAYADAHAEAVRCLGALHALGRAGGAAAPCDLGFLALVLGGGDPGEVVRRALGPLIDYDAKRGTDLLGTVEQYFAAGRSLGRTGEALHIHVNTVTQRLERTARLLGSDWQEPARSLEIQLALQIRRVMEL